VSTPNDFVKNDYNPSSRNVFALDEFHENSIQPYRVPLKIWACIFTCNTKAHYRQERPHFKWFNFKENVQAGTEKTVCNEVFVKSRCPWNGACLKSHSWNFSVVKLGKAGKKTCNRNKESKESAEWKSCPLPCIVYSPPPPRVGVTPQTSWWGCAAC